MIHVLIALLLVGALICVFQRRSVISEQSAGSVDNEKAATTYTKKIHKAVLKQLPFDNQVDFELAQKGFIGRPERLVITAKTGDVIWDMDSYKEQVLGSSSPDTVNPSLWRQACLNSLYGLYQVRESIYQVRGYDLSVMTIIEGTSGYIIVDPLTSEETAAAAMELVYEYLAKKPIKAVIYTHSHLDHFGGVKGVVTAEQVAQEQIKIIAPKGFVKEAVSENVLLGNAMSRRASYMYGNLLPKNRYGQVDCGLGKGASAGRPTLIMPTDIIDTSEHKMDIDGVAFVFQYTPNTEAPAEMNFFLPEHNALCIAENAVHTLHNLYTLRGAQVRDAKAWVQYLTETIELFGVDIQVVFASHNWPIWGNKEAMTFLEKQRDMYKYIHDQTLRLANHGHTMLEIAEMIQLPPSLAHEWYNRGYYGTVNHNVKGVYQRYLGWYDGNPANLHPLPPVAAGKKFVEYMGGAQKVLQRAQEDFEKGNYRWVVQVLNHLICANPDNTEAKALQAAALEQLGYQSESGPWRNVYLSGAQELRRGIVQTITPDAASKDIINAMSFEMIFDYFAIRLNGPQAGEQNITIAWHFTDSDVRYITWLQHAVLHYKKGNESSPDVAITTTRDVFFALVLGFSTVEKELKKGTITISNTDLFTNFIALFDTFEFWFTLVTP